MKRSDKKLDINGNLALVNTMGGGESTGIFVEDPELISIIKEYTDTKGMTASELVDYYCGDGKCKKARALILVKQKDAQRFFESTKEFNRSADGKNYKRIKSDMCNAKWEDTSDMWLFNTKGQLINAGHRAKGIMETGVPQYVTMGFNFSFSPKQDRGSKRTISQNIKMMIRLGEPVVDDINDERIFANSYICAAVTLILNRYGIDGGDASNVIEYMKNNKDVIKNIGEMMLDGTYKRSKNNKGLFAAGFIASCIIANECGISLEQLKKYRDVWGSAGKIVDESMDGTRYDEMLEFRDRVNMFGLADSGNKNAYFRDCLIYFYAVDRFKKLTGRKNNREEILRDMPVAFKCDYNSRELSIPWNATYKDGRK